VRIDRIQIDAFGRLAGFDTGPEPLDGLVAVLGPNEAGKSTLFAFLATTLYGFQPAARETNPHVPWGASEAAGRVRMRLDAGGCADVERRLRSQPSGRMTLADAVTDLRNQPLPWVEHVPRGVFRQVFAITLAELAGLDGDTWARIQDKVVGSMGATDLRSARVAAESLEKEAGELWRPSRRGNQRLRDLQQDTRALRARLTAARERDERVRALVQEREAVQTALDAARVARHRDRAAVERAQTLLPLKQQLDRVAALRAQGGERELLEGLPSDPVAELASLSNDRDGIRAKLASLDAELAEHAAVVAAFDVRARGLLEHREATARLIAKAAASGPERARAGGLEAEIRDFESRLDAAGARLLAGSWRDQQTALAKVPIDVIKDRLANFPSMPTATKPTRGGRGAAVVMLLSGLGLLAWGIASNNAPVSALGAALAAAGMILWASRRQPTDARRAPATAEDPLALLGGVRLRPEHRRMAEGLLADLSHMRTLLQWREERQRSLGAARARIAAVDAELTSSAAALGVGAGQEALDAEALAALLEAELREAEGRRTAASQAERDVRRLGRDRDRSAATLASLEASITELEKRGAALDPVDPARGLEAARDRLGAHRRADELEADIQSHHPDLAELEKQVAALESTHTEVETTDLPGTRARLEALEEEIVALSRRAEALDQNISHLRDLETVDAVDSEIATLKETEARLARERDRKWLLATLLREADRRFREEHQPDLLRRAGSYLAHLTGGRYERLIVDETEGGHLFRLVGPGLPTPVALAAPISTGTLEQAYLALRLAIVDHLDRGGERLPLFVDEVFVNWDAERRDRGIEVLAGISAQRQVFVFTCHPSVAEELARRGGRVLALGRSG